jgi:tRNA-2-methylthio-N6-dimethylallyladenosine synthase
MLYHILTLGCQMNLSDSEKVITVLNDMGLSRTENEDEASILGIVACSVRQGAINKVYSRIHKWNKMKARKPLLTFVSGCILPSDKDKFLKLFDMVFSMGELAQLPDLISQNGIVTPMGLRNQQHSYDKEIGLHQVWSVRPQYTSTFEAFVPIQNGCDKFCSFCAVPYTRGREVSRDSPEIIEEVKELVDRGYKSITLLGQNVNSYGLDKKGAEISFAQLLREIGELGRNTGAEFLTYFTSPHPRDMSREVIDVVAEYPVLAKQIHLPLQSGDDRVLIHMNRKHKLAEYRDIVHYIRAKLPTATLFTDIIVGFTGETDEQFQHTMDAFDEFQFNMAYIAQYSPRPGALSSRWIDDVPHDTKKQRFHLLTRELEKHSGAYNKQLVGKTMRVLVTGLDRKGGYLSGLTEGKINVRISSGNPELVGTFVDVHMDAWTEFSLAGAYVGEKSLEEVS